MKRTIAALLAVLAITAAAHAEPATSDFTISAGGGLAYELGGLNFAARYGHVEGYLGVGLLSLLPGAAAGARFFLLGDGSGFFLALNFAGHLDDLHIDDDEATGGRMWWATVTPGYRLGAGRAFVQIAAGGGILKSQTFYDSRTPSYTKVALIPDAAVGIGVRFF